MCRLSCMCLNVFAYTGITVAMSYLIKIQLKAKDESEWRQNTSHHASFSELRVKEGIMDSICLGGRALCPGPRGTSSRMGPSIRWEDDPSYPCGVWLVQLYLIGQEQRAALHQGVWHSADIRSDPLIWDSLLYFHKYFKIELICTSYTENKRKMFKGTKSNRHDGCYNSSWHFTSTADVNVHFQTHFLSIKKTVNTVSLYCSNE